MCILFIPFRNANDLLRASVMSLQERHTLFKIGKPKNVYPYTVLFNIEYNALSSKEAQNFTAEIPIATGSDIIRGLSSDQQATQAEAALNTDGWEEFQFHIPDPSPDRVRTLMNSNEIQLLTGELKRLNDEKETQLIETNTVHPLSSSSNLLLLEDFGTYAMFVKSLKTEGKPYVFHTRINILGTCLDQWNTLKLVAQHIWDLVYRPENTSPIRIMLHGEGGTGKSFIINAITKLFSYLEKPDMLVKRAFTGKAAIGIQGDTIDRLFAVSRSKFIVN